MEFINFVRAWVYLITMVMIISWLGFIGFHGCIAAVNVASDPNRGKTNTERHIFSARTSDMWSK